MTHDTVSKLGMTAALLFSLAGGSRAMAQSRDTVPEMAGITTALGGNASALTYWVREADGLHAVTTVSAADGGEEGVVRFSATLLPGQVQEISVPGPVGSEARVLRISRHGGKVSVALVNAPEPAQAQAAQAAQAQAVQAQAGKPRPKRG